MSDSKYGAVDFKNIREHYVSDADIVCRFEYTHCEPHPGDEIAIKRICWQKDELHEPLVSVSASAAVPDDPCGKIMRITFPRSLFAGLTAWPDDELFHFWYIRSTELMGVSSISFSIIRPKESDYADFSRDSDGNDDDGFVVLRSPQALLQEKMEKLQTDLTAVEAEKMLLEIRNTALNQELDQLKEKVEQEKVIIQQHKDESASELEALRTENQRLGAKLAEALASHAENVSAITEELAHEKNKHQGVLLALQETCDELTRVRAENAEVRKSLSDWTRRRQEEEQLTEANDLMIRVLKEEVQKLEQKASMAKAERDFAIGSQQAAQKSLEQITELRQRDEAENNALIAELRQSVELTSNTAEEYKLRLDKAKVEYEERYKYGVKLESKLQRLREKVNMIRPISRTTSASESVPESSETIPKDRSFPAAESNAKATGPGGLQCEDCGMDLQPGHDRLVCPICEQSFCKKIAGIESRFHCHVEGHFASGTAAAGPGSAAAVVTDQEAQTSDKPAPLCRNCTREEDGGKHGQLVCPICSREFCKKIPGIDSYFHCHVESHFDPRHYPTDV